jgi:hypothetical protein
LPIAGEAEERKVQALIKLEVACRLALEALPDAPAEEELRQPIKALCEVTERELNRIRPGWKPSSGTRD